MHWMAIVLPHLFLLSCFFFFNHSFSVSIAWCSSEIDMILDVNSPAFLTFYCFPVGYFVCMIVAVLSTTIIVYLNLYMYLLIDNTAMCHCLADLFFHSCLDIL